MPKQKTPVTFDEHLGAVVSGYMRMRPLLQPALARRLRWSDATVGRKLRGQVEITVSELLEISVAVGRTADTLINDALANYGGIEKLMSEVAPTNDIQAQIEKRQAEALSKTTEELDAEETKAANVDPERDQPESDPT